MEETYEPKTLVEAIRYFSDLDVCVRYFCNLRWPNGIECPKCGSKKPPSYVSSRRIFKCAACRKQFSPKAGSIFEDSALGLDKWLTALWIIATAKNGASSHELARSLGVTQKTAWFMSHRIRLAMEAGTFTKKLSGTVEADETFVGGKASNMHRDVRNRKITGTGGKDKTIVVGLRERDGRIVATVSETRKRGPLHAFVKDNVTPGANLYTDALKSYEGLGGFYKHEVIDHNEMYVFGDVHTNGMENFWCLLKRSLKGTYTKVDPFHLFRYVNEHTYRYNERHGGDSERFRGVVRNSCGRRLTYREVTGKSASTK